MAIGTAELKKLMRLACIAPTEEKADKASESLINDLNAALELIEEINTADTEGVTPLAHPLDIVQPLRADKAEPSIDRDSLQKGAPKIHNGFYMVPRVVEKT